MRFRTKLMLIFSLLIVLICGAFLVFSLGFFKNRMIADAEDRRSSLTRHLHNEIIDMVYAGDVLQLTATLRNICKDVTYIDYIFVIDDDGHLLAHTFDTVFPSELFNANLLSADKTALSRLLLTSKGRVRDFAMRTARHMPGEIHVGMNEEVFYKQINDSVKMTIIMTIVCLALGLFLVYTISGYLSKPLKNLSLGMKKIENGDLEYRLEEKGDYEVLNLLQGYNRMTESILDSTTRLQQAEEALRKERNFSQSIIDTAQAIILLLNPDGSVAEFNPYMEKLSGYSIEEVRGKDWFETFLPEHDRQKIGELFTKAISDIKTKGNINPIVTRDGKELTIEWFDRTLKDKNGDITGILAIGQDITERRNIEEQLRQSQKMEAIGMLAGGVAHDFNNLLTVILGNAQLASMNVVKDESLRKRIEEIKKAGEKAASLTRQLLAFSRKQIVQPKLLDINEVINEMEKMLKHMIGENIDFQTVLGPELWKICADPGQINQIIMNMVINSRDAMLRGGGLTIETANADLNENYFCEHGIKEVPGHYVMLAVSDTGSGMDKETQEHIFEPFFTTKEVGQGTGLGLSTIYGIVKQNNGFIWVYSEPGKGTTFKVYLPKVKDVEPEEKEQTPVDDSGGSETVLIVEDDDNLRKFAQRALQMYGYRILDAENGEDALRVCGEYEGQIDLMITDVVMPKMGGREAAERLQHLYPQIKVIYMSGYTDNTIVHYGVLAPELNFIQKPFTPKGLARKVRETLESEK